MERPYNIHQRALKLDLNYRTTQCLVEKLMDEQIVERTISGYGKPYGLTMLFRNNIEIFNEIEAEIIEHEKVTA